MDDPLKQTPACELDRDNRLNKPLLSADGKWYCRRCDEYYTPYNRDYRCPYCQR